MERKKLYDIAQVLVDYSLRLQEGERVVIHNMDTQAAEFVNILYDVCIQRGASQVNVWWDTDEIRESIYKCSSATQAKSLLKSLTDIIYLSDCYIKIKSGLEVSYMHGENVIEYNNQLRPIYNMYANSSIRRVLMYYPSKSLASRAGISTRRLFNQTHKFIVETDWKVLQAKNEKLKELMESTDKIRIQGPKTHLTLSIKGQDVISAHGRRNMPDGEVFTSPIRTSVNGHVTFDLKTQYYGVTFSQISLKIKKGRVIDAQSTSPKKTELLNQILDSHKQNRYFGEFAIGTNPMITHPYNFTLFDEKILGTFHMALGTCYARTPNGNGKATIHWDLIKDMRRHGSQIWFDDVLVMKDGKLLLD